MKTRWAVPILVACLAPLVLAADPARVLRVTVYSVTREGAKDAAWCKDPAPGTPADRSAVASAAGGTAAVLVWMPKLDASSGSAKLDAIAQFAGQRVFVGTRARGASTRASCTTTRARRSAIVSPRSRTAAIPRGLHFHIGTRAWCCGRNS